MKQGRSPQVNGWGVIIQTFLNGIRGKLFRAFFSGSWTDQQQVS